LHLALVDDRPLHALAGTEGALDDRAVADVLERGAHERAALARLDVLELDQGEEPVVEVDGHPVLEVGGGDLGHGYRPVCSARHGSGAAAFRRGSDPWGPG